MRALGDFDAISFDCYGTLIDWETGIWSALEGWARRCGWNEDDLLEAFGRTETVIEQRYPTDPYPGVLRRVARRLASLGSCEITAEETDRFAASVGSWPAFADSRTSLETLEESFKLLVLSNVDLDSFSRSNEQLGVTFDRVLTAEEIGSYKPNARNFAALIGAAGAMGVDLDRLLHVAQSLYHDHVPAKDAGLATAWIDRRRGRHGHGATPPPMGAVEPDWVFASLAEFAAAATARPLT